MLISRFRGHVARVARSYGLNAHQVDDVAQETWLRLYRHIGSVRDPHALGAWLGTTASRESLRALAGDRREEPTDEELCAGAATADDVTDALARAERSVALKRALGTLPPRHRALMESLLAEPEPSYAEISAAARDPDRQHRPDPRPLRHAAAARADPRRRDGSRGGLTAPAGAGSHTSTVCLSPRGTPASRL